MFLWEYKEQMEGTGVLPDPSAEGKLVLETLNQAQSNKHVLPFKGQLTLLDGNWLSTLPAQRPHHPVLCEPAACPASHCGGV